MKRKQIPKRLRRIKTPRIAMIIVTGQNRSGWIRANSR
jgi:hypothetical protein